MNWYLIKKQSQFSSTFSQEKLFWTNDTTTGNPKEKKKWVYIQILYLLIPFTRINTKCIIGLSVKHKIIKLLGDNVG